MTEYGVVTTGFSRKPLTVIIAELEAANIIFFGPGLIQTSQSPMGQLNGLRADAITRRGKSGRKLISRATRNRRKVSTLIFWPACA